MDFDRSVTGRLNWGCAFVFNRTPMGGGGHTRADISPKWESASLGWICAPFAAPGHRIPAKTAAKRFGKDTV